MKHAFAVTRFTLALFALTRIGSAAAADFVPATYAIDPMHSKIGFEVPHLVISSVEGRFDAYEGKINLAKKFTDSTFDLSIDAKSIDTGTAKRDDHLRSPDFFDVARYPKIVFKSRRVEGAPESFRVTGDLTIRGVTKEVVLDAKYLGSVKDGFGQEKVAFSATTSVHRKDFGLAWNGVVEAGPVVGDAIAITLKVQAARAK